MTGFTVPNVGDPAYLDTDYQSRIFAAHLDILGAAVGGQNGVVGSGLAITPSGPAGMTVEGTSGAIASDGVLYSVTGGTVSIADADPTLHRFDLIIAKSTGTLDKVTGAPDTAPILDSPIAGSVGLASIYVPPADLAINANQITDLRVFVPDPTQVTAGWTTIVAETDLARTNTAALTADDELTFVMVNGTKYRIRGFVVWKHTSGTTSQTVKWGITGPASPTHMAGNARFQGGFAPNSGLVGGSFGYSPVGITGYGDSSTSAQPNSMILSLANYMAFMSFDLIVHNGSNTADFAIIWSQQTASGANTMTRLAGSYLEYEVV